MEEIDEVVKLVLRERVQQQVAEQVVDVLVRWIECGEKYRDEAVAKIEAENDLENCVLWIQERMQETAPQITEEVVEVKEVITDLMNKLQFTDDTELNIRDDRFGSAIRFRRVEQE